MKKNILILIILFSFLLSQSEQPYPPVTLVSIPTAGTMPKGYFAFENIFMNQGSIVPKFMIGITDNFMLGMSFGISNFIGDGHMSKFKSYPEVQIKYRLFDETETIPAIVMGIDTQGRGEFIESENICIDEECTSFEETSLNRYDQKSYGFYIALSRNFSALGNFGFHFGLNKNLSENDDNDDDINIFMGFDKEINRSFSLYGEYNFARNDDLYIGDESIEDILDRKGKGYFNAGLRWSASDNLMLEMNINDISKNNKVSDSINRELKVIYYESF
tara:strand:+ start:16664 stop:17488 length:825 start_codon:yes stop_codon:yes gene_type:complete